LGFDLGRDGVLVLGRDGVLVLGRDGVLVLGRDGVLVLGRDGVLVLGLDFLEHPFPTIHLQVVEFIQSAFLFFEQATIY
jgi:hypothetical protein